MVDKDFPIPIKGSPHSNICGYGKKVIRLGWGEGGCGHPDPNFPSVTQFRIICFLFY